MVDTDRQPRRRYFGGVCALIAVVFIWVSSSFAMNVSATPMIRTANMFQHANGSIIEHIWRSGIQQAVSYYLSQHRHFLLLLITTAICKETVFRGVCKVGILHCYTCIPCAMLTRSAVSNRLIIRDSESNNQVRQRCCGWGKKG